MVARDLLTLSLSLWLLVLISTATGAGMDKDGDGEKPLIFSLSTMSWRLRFPAQEERAAEAAAHRAAQEMGHEQATHAAEEEQQEDAAASAAAAQAKAEVDAAMKKGIPLQLTRENAHIILDGTQNAFFKFSTSWCGHCVKMQPDWERLARIIHKDFKGCRIVSVDCEQQAEVCQAFGVEGYPTIMLLKWTKTPEGEIGYQPVPYKEAREFGAMLGFLRSNKAAKAKNPIMATIKGLIAQVFKIEVAMPK